MQVYPYVLTTLRTFLLGWAKLNISRSMVPSWCSSCPRWVGGITQGRSTPYKCTGAGYRGSILPQTFRHLVFHLVGWISRKSQITLFRIIQSFLASPLIDSLSINPLTSITVPRPCDQYHAPSIPLTIRDDDTMIIILSHLLLAITKQFS